MKILNSSKIAVQLIASFLVISLIMLVVAVVGYIGMKNINDGTTNLYHYRTLPIEWVGRASSGLYQLRGDVYKFILIPEQRDNTELAIQADIDTINQQFEYYRGSHLSSKEADALKRFDTSWLAYQQAVEEIQAQVQSDQEDQAIQSLIDGHAHTSRKALDEVMSEIVDINHAEAEAINLQTDQTFANTLRFFLAMVAFGLAAAVILGIFISRRISLPLGKVTRTAHQIADLDLQTLANEMRAFARGDLTRKLEFVTQPLDIDRGDEVGQLAYSFNTMIHQLMEVGQVFREMANHIHESIAEVSINAANLQHASAQLNEAASQAGQATGQIAMTIQQVSRGISQEAQSINATAGSVEQMSQAIEGVARGAQDQSAAVDRSSEITVQITTAIERVAANARTGADGAQQAASVAREGAEKVTKTMNGMAVIQEKVGQSVLRVKEMGQRSDQIGAIIETIDDIATQTNLLALNAAIEAARAGEHGKGFAVVADEVRKLAEKSSVATKEITTLIKEIQATVNEAVRAMAEGASEVEAGVVVAGESGQALTAVLSSVEHVTQQVTEIALAAEQMKTLSVDLMAASNAVDSVVEQNTASTQEMAAGSNEVSRSIENIASVSEENSAAIEEVSASTDEINAQVEEVTASAQELSDMARLLKKLVDQFKL
jgi:methyl-accepting chemotaxis protein